MFLSNLFSKLSASIGIPLQLSRYFVTGGVAALADLGAFILLLSLDLSVVFSAICSFALAAILNYLLSSRFVFKTEVSGRQFLLFLAAAILGLGVNVGITYLKINLFDLAPSVAKLFGIGGAFLINYAMNRALVFRT